MKNNVKRLIATIAAAAAVTSIASFASAQNANDLYINGAFAEDYSIKVIDEQKFLPLRAVCEELGFDVEWVNDTRTIIISKMPVYITCSPDYDGYTFARTAPMLLGEAPRLVDDLTYVPLNFVEEILKGDLEETEDGVFILYGEIAQNNTISGEVCEVIYENEVPVQIVLGNKDDIMSQTILNLSQELSNLVVDLGIDAGSYITAEITDVMTMSIPAQVIPTAITVEQTQAVTVETVEISGTVCELIYDENDNLIQIATGDKEDVMSQVVYNLTEELAKEVLALEITEGSQIKGTAQAMQTMSIPAQMPLVSIELVK